MTGPGGPDDIDDVLRGLAAARRDARAPHPQSTPPALIERILELALEHPEWGCVRVADQLKAEGPGVSSPTVQTILIKHGLGGKPERVRRLEAVHLAEGRPLTAEQEALVTRANPAFRERHAWPGRPGELLIQESFIVGYFDRLGKLYLHAVVDAWNGMAFAELYPAKRAEMAVALLHKQVLPFYGGRHLPIGAVLTDHSHEYGKYPYQLFLEMQRIGHQTTDTRGPGKHGAYERFHDEAMAECFKPMDRGPTVLDIAAPRAALASWLAHYNRERPSPGFPNRGQAPAAAFEAYMAIPKG